MSALPSTIVLGAFKVVKEAGGSSRALDHEACLRRLNTTSQAAQAAFVIQAAA